MSSKTKPTGEPSRPIASTSQVDEPAVDADEEVAMPIPDDIVIQAVSQSNKLDLINWRIEKTIILLIVIDIIISKFIERNAWNKIENKKVGWTLA